jgi:hypothetical protein
MRVKALDLVLESARPGGKEYTMTTSVRERERALAWIASQLQWERTLSSLRRGTTEPVVDERQAA